MKKSIRANLFVFIVVFIVMFCPVKQALASVSAEMIGKTQTCAACHGQQGISSNPEWPSLAGQHAAYLRKQLIDYKKGENRQAMIMTGITANLSEKDIDFLAGYYATMSRVEGETPQKYRVLGEQLYRNGDFDKGITACIACHGPQGTGNGEAGFPALSGQQALYTIQQLHAFKDKTRRNDLNHIMQDISGRMSDEDMAAVAYYIQGLH